MRMTGKTLIGLILLVTGLFILLDAIGIHVGQLFGLIFAGIMILFGIHWINHARSSFKKGLGAALLILGLLSLVGAAHLFFGVLLAVVAMYFGFKMLKNHSSTDGDSDRPVGSAALKGRLENAVTRIEDSFEQEWNRIMKNKS